jgi:hypothetical protein
LDDLEAIPDYRACVRSKDYWDDNYVTTGPEGMTIDPQTGKQMLAKKPSGERYESWFYRDRRLGAFSGRTSVCPRILLRVGHGERFDEVDIVATLL